MRVIKLIELKQHLKSWFNHYDWKTKLCPKLQAHLEPTENWSPTTPNQQWLCRSPTCTIQYKHFLNGYSPIVLIWKSGCDNFQQIKRRLNKKFGPGLIGGLQFEDNEARLWKPKPTCFPVVKTFMCTPDAYAWSKSDNTERTQRRGNRGSPWESFMKSVYGVHGTYLLSAVRKTNTSCANSRL